MRKVLVTGASGFVGRHLLKYLLEQNFDVHVAYRNSAYRPNDVTIHLADLLEPGEAERLMKAVQPTHLLHLAWDVSPGLFWHARNNLDWVVASLALYRAFVNVGGKRAVFTGTCAEYDWGSEWLDETSTPRKPQTLYGVAKNSLFDLITAVGEPHTQFAWGRLFFLYGPGEPPKRLVPDVMDSLLRGMEIACTSGRQERDFLHVADAARALVSVLVSDYCGAVNIASGECHPVRAIVEKIGVLAGRPELLRFGAKHSPENEPKRLVANVSVLKGLGFTPRYSLDEGLKQTWEWRQNPN